MNYEIILLYDDKDFNIAKAFLDNLSKLPFPVWADFTIINIGDSYNIGKSKIQNKNICFLLILTDSLFNSLKQESYTLFSITFNELIQIVKQNPTQKIIIYDFEENISDSFNKWAYSVGLYEYCYFKHGDIFNKTFIDKSNLINFYIKCIQKYYIVFPQENYILKNQAYDLSWAGSGKNDTIHYISAFSKFELINQNRIPILIDNQNIPILKLQFNHCQSKDSANSWWSAVIGIKTKIEKDWDVIDINYFDSIEIIAKGTNITKGKIPLKIRFEDDDTNATSGSCHQSSSWNYREIILTDTFNTFILNSENDFKWDKQAWHWNTKNVNKNRILQITFGYDNKDCDIEAIIEIKQIMLHLKVTN